MIHNARSSNATRRVSLATMGREADGFGSASGFSQDAFPAGYGGTAMTVQHRDPELDPETGLPLWSATRLATLQCKLSQRLGPEYLSQRPGPGGGPKLTYIEGWKAVDLANEVFGFNGWSTSVQRLDVDYLDVHVESGRCNCGVSAIVRITLRDGTYHEDVGYGHAEGVRGKHAALEKCKKEAITDSIKRGLKTFGKLLGNCLYDRQYAREVLKVPVPPAPFNPAELHRRTDMHAPQPTSKPAAGTKRAADTNAAAAEAAAKQARLRQAEAAKAAHRRKQEQQSPPQAAGARPRVERGPVKPEPGAAPSRSASAEHEEADTVWYDDMGINDAEAESMAVELELEQDMLLRQSQLAQELDDDTDDGATSGSGGPAAAATKDTDTPERGSRQALEERNGR